MQIAASPVGFFSWGRGGKWADARCRAMDRSVVDRNTVGRSGTLAPAVRFGLSWRRGRMGRTDLEEA